MFGILRGARLLTIGALEIHPDFVRRGADSYTLNFSRPAQASFGGSGDTPAGEVMGFAAAHAAGVQSHDRHRVCNLGKLDMKKT